MDHVVAAAQQRQQHQQQGERASSWQLLDQHRVQSSQQRARAVQHAPSSLRDLKHPAIAAGAAHAGGFVDRVVEPRHAVDRHERDEAGGDRDQRGILERRRNERRPGQNWGGRRCRTDRRRWTSSFAAESSRAAPSRPASRMISGIGDAVDSSAQRRRGIGFDRADARGLTFDAARWVQAGLRRRKWRRSCAGPASASNSRISYIETIGTRRSASRKPVRNRPIVPPKMAQSQMVGA